MIGEADWDMHWRWEIFRRACDPLDVRRWKRDSSVALWSLLGKPGARVLDSTCGLGDHTINLRDAGFDVEACDASPFAIECAARNIEEAKLEVPLFVSRWQDLGKRTARYDVVFNDVIHWIYDPNDLREAAAGLYDALVPGGSLVFFFADGREPAVGAGRKILSWDWEHMSRTELAWEHEKDGTRVSLALLNERGDDFIDQHHFYVIRERDRRLRSEAEKSEEFPGARGRSPRNVDQLKLESFTMRRVYRWDFHALSRALADVGFRDITSHAFQNVKGHGYALNLARK